MTKNKNPTADSRRRAALTICRTLSDELSVVAKPLARVNIKNIPDNVEPAIRAWIKAHAGNHEVYGSAAAATHRIGGRIPGDLDIIVDKPQAAAKAVAAIIRKKKIRCQIAERKVGGGYVIKIHNKKGNWVEAVDFHSWDGHVGKYELYGKTKAPRAKNGIMIQRASDQLLRKGNEITKKQPNGTVGAAAHRNVKDTQDFIVMSKTLLASLELKSTAEQARAARVRKAITVWERHLKTLKGAPKLSKRKAIAKTRTKRFTQKARANPSGDVENLIFVDSTPRVVERGGRGHVQPQTATREEVYGGDQAREFWDVVRDTTLIVREQDLPMQPPMTSLWGVPDGDPYGMTQQEGAPGRQSSQGRRPQGRTQQGGATGRQTGGRTQTGRQSAQGRTQQGGATGQQTGGRTQTGRQTPHAKDPYGEETGAKAKRPSSYAKDPYGKATGTKTKRPSSYAKDPYGKATKGKKKARR